MTLMQLYLFTVILPNAYHALDCLSVICLMALATLLVTAIYAVPVEEPEFAKRIFRWVVRFAVSFVVLTLIAIPLPSDKQLYTLAGGYVATNTKDVAKLPDNVVKAANAWLEKASKLADEESGEKTKKTK